MSGWAHTRSCIKRRMPYWLLSIFFSFSFASCAVVAVLFLLLPFHLFIFWSLVVHNFHNAFHMVIFVANRCHIQMSCTLLCSHGRVDTTKDTTIRSSPPTKHSHYSNYKLSSDFCFGTHTPTTSTTHITDTKLGITKNKNRKNTHTKRSNWIICHCSMN